MRGGSTGIETSAMLMHQFPYTPAYAPASLQWGTALVCSRCRRGRGREWLSDIESAAFIGLTDDQIAEFLMQLDDQSNDDFSGCK